MTNPIAYNITELFTKNKYVIPVYQRNYAWGEAQIHQLIQDIWDSKKEVSDYYLGTLIIFSNRIKDSKFETIDGQQRLTTLAILISVLKNNFNCDIEDISTINLDFDSRKKSTNTLKIIFEDPNSNRKDLNTNILIAYDNINKKLNELISESTSQNEFDEFCSFLFKKVKLLQVSVPNDTNLNHYFEIMNNRGEQLEKHEIVKAYCLKTLENESIRTAFAKVWDACSQMDKYVQYGFDINTRHRLFGKGDWNMLPKNFEDIVSKIGVKQTDAYTTNENPTLSSLLANSSKHKNDDSANKTNNEKPERFNTIINFSNFLLQVIRVSLKKDIQLDDKKLIATFKENINTSEDVQKFGYHLLKCKVVYDKYIIKREFYKDEWTLKQLKCYDGNKGNYINSFDHENERIVMLLSMFHVSFPTMIYKHWFTAVLKYIFENDTFTEEEYIKYLEITSDNFFYGRSNTKSEKDDYFEIIFNNFSIENLDIDTDNSLHIGTNVKNFIFNRLDYLIWRDFNLSIKNDFKFSFRSSVEHYFPQNPKNEEKFESDINRFGNLCLISRSKNSELSNYSPLAKKEHYSKSASIESLKQQLMMKFEKWDKTAFEKHENEMIALLLTTTDRV